MLILLSPSKSFTNRTPPLEIKASVPLFDQKTAAIINKLQNLSITSLQKQLSISKSLAELNYDRYQHWESAKSKPALWSYSGDVYNGLDAFSMDKETAAFAQKNLAIITGLYGLLRPLDLIKSYRLEMKIPLNGTWGKSLYEAWSTEIGEYITASGATEVLLCSSKEYSKAVPHENIPYRTLTPRFYQDTADGLKEKGLFAKYARGKLARWAIDQRLSNLTDLQHFNEDGFRYSPDLSTDSELAFIIPADFTLKGRFKKL